jgi:hypothetical protein
VFETNKNEALNMISLFSICSGLRANFDKTQVNWIGARQGCGFCNLSEKGYISKGPIIQKLINLF